MTITTAELRESVAEHIRILSTDTPLDAADAAKIDRYITRVTATEREKGLIWWPDNAIPDACEMPMMLMVAALAAAGFGKAGQGYESGYQDGRTALATLKPSAQIDTVRMEYF